MLKKLSYSVTFPTTGRDLTETVLFEGGFGAITGPNESGKSMIIEMIRFCLFGTAALRGTTAEYSKLNAELVFTLKGEEYTAKRTISTARIYRGKEEIAVGIRPANEKIVQLFGFGLDVFDMACVANQDELIKLGAMRPTERKRMVDSVIGLGVLDDLAKEAGEEATTLNRRADDMMQVAREPIMPILPPDYEPSSRLAEDRDRLMSLKSQYDQLQGWLSVEAVEPVAPQTNVMLSSEDLKPLVEAQQELKAQRRALEAEIKNLPKPSIFSPTELDFHEGVANAHQQTMKKLRFLNQHEEPTYTEDQLVEIEAQWAPYETFCDLTDAEYHLSRRNDQGTHTCPACKHSWPVDAAGIARLQAEIDELVKLPLHKEEPVLTLEQIARERGKIQAWIEVADQWEALKDIPDEAPKPKIDLDQIAMHRRANASVTRRVELEKQIADLGVALDKQPDFETMYGQRMLYEQQLISYGEALSTYEAWKAERGRKFAQAVVLEPEIAKLPEVVELFESCRVYEQALAGYESYKKEYDQLLENIEEFRAEAEEWKKVRTALTTLRGLIKQHLVPSLNRVASNLIDQMTGGQRQRIEVDEEFNILVDDQSIDTLSGSGKAVANLALRLGLGQVLTNNVLSLFMGDEIDASMDKDRAEQTSLTLQALRRKISQILLVTHKYPIADYHIAIGKHSEHTLQ